MVQQELNYWWQLTLHEWWVLGVFLASFVFIVLSLRNRSKLLNLLNIEDEQVTKLKQQISEMERKISALEATIQILLKTIPQPNQIIEVNIAEEKAAVRKRVTRPVLLVYGEPEFGEEDRTAMRRAGLSFFRLKNASLKTLHDELQRRRSEGTLYDMVHISAHGDLNVIGLGADNVDGNDLSNIFSGIRGVFLNTCSNQYIADKLVGVVLYVIVIYDEIPTEVAANFAYEFYKRYAQDMDIEKSFAGALLVMPDVSDFVDLRIGGKR
jgi:hypothetical protein